MRKKMETMLSMIPGGLWPIIISVALGLALWSFGVSSVGEACIFALLLELVIVNHRILHRTAQVERTFGLLPANRRVPQILRDVGRISENPNRFVQICLDNLVSQVGQRVAQLRAGRQQYEPHAFMALAEKFYEALGKNDKLWATSLLGGGTYWHERFSGAYKEYNRQASSRGVEIQRIFILRDQAHLNSLQDILTEQADFSTVYVVLLSEAQSKRVGRALQRDFLVINSDIAAEFHFSQPDMEDITGMDIITEPHEVRTLRGDIARIRDELAESFIP